ncbi:MAG: XdhC family protein [Gammaproteobacteria bacterium]|nr:XdhC family protein [Gammaproteobacteria bacterium]
MSTKHPCDLLLEHPATILREALARRQQGLQVSLVVVWSVSGSSSRAVGSMAMVDEHGLHGYVSHGCIDADIKRHAELAMQSGDIHTVLYGAGSPYMDLRLPCGGSLELLFLPNPDIEPLIQAVKSLDRREEATVCISPTLGLVTDIGLDTQNFRYRPPARIALAGRGALLRAAARQAVASGFEIMIASPDLDDLEALSDLQPSESLRLGGQTVSLPLDPNTALLCLFHDHSWETELLINALNQQPFYIGALGSVKTHENRRQTLLKLGIKPSQLDRIVGPIGLVMRLKEANAIALSALAQILSLRPAMIEQIDTGQAPTLKQVND